VNKLKLYLCCNGNADKSGFVYCNSCANSILDFAKIRANETDVDKLIDFLDKAAGLFDSPVINHNKAFNVINLIQKDFHLFTEDQVNKIQYFFKLHKDCGVFLQLIPEV
jgi:hypothetical protein